MATVPSPIPHLGDKASPSKFSDSLIPLIPLIPPRPLRLLAAAFFAIALPASAANPPLHGLGERLPTPAEKALEDQTSIVVDKVYLNKYGLDRLNKERAVKGLKALDEKEVDLGDNDNFISGKTRKGNKIMRPQVRKATLKTGAAQSTATASIVLTGASSSGTGTSGTGTSTGAAASLPSSVDNSTNIWMPPVGNQNSEGACASYSSCYYTMTYMTARANNWNVTAGPQNEIFSPQFIYNMINGGYDDGSYVGSAYQVMASHGAPFLSVWPYNGNYTTLPTTAALWRNAIPYRMGNNGSITNLDTAAGLQNLKTMLANGYICNFCLDVYNWHFTTIKSDPAPGADNSLVGWPVCDYANGSFDASGHCMTVVGYDDNVWVDINNNGVVDPGEMGAFKVVNQWGTSGFGRNGYAYVSYDAIKPTSAVAGTGTYDNSNREAAFWYQTAYWIQARPAGYKPVLLAQFDLNTSNRSATTLTLGYGTTPGIPPAVTWQPYGLQGSGDLNMAGGTTASDGTCVLDYTDIAAGGTSLDWFLDFSNYPTSTTIKSFILTDGSGNQLASCAGTLPSGGLPLTVVSNTTGYLWASTKLTDSSPPGAVTDLSVAGTSATAASLTWTQPGNDGSNGVAFAYTLVYSTSPITSSNFSSATPFATGTTPGVPGSTGQVTVTGLTPGGTYYFALETSDYEGNSSAISNVPSATLPSTLSITTPITLPSAIVGLPYATQLQATGGVTPYTWSSLSTSYGENTSGTATLSTSTNGIGCTGPPGSSAYYAFTNGFTFPIGGGTSAYVFVYNNGSIAILGNTFGILGTISPFQTTLSTAGTGEDVYVTNDASHAVFRWQAHQSGTNSSVVFEAVLYSSGNVQFNYGHISGVSGTTPALIGIEPATGGSFVSSRSGATTEPYGSTSYMTLYSGPVPGLAFDPSTGILSGTPVLTSTFSAPLAVTDSSSLPQTVSANFGLTVSGSGSILEIVPGATTYKVPMGGSLNIPIQLSQAPASPLAVSASFTSGDTDISITGGSSLTFTSSNWNTPQNLILSAPANVVNGEAVITLSASGLASVPLIVTESDPAPTLVSGPTVSPSTVTGTQATVSATATDNNGASALTYTWSTVGTPPAAVTFVLNGSNNGQNSPAIFTKAGSYNLKVTVADASGNTVSGTTGVTVAQTVTGISVLPLSAAVQTSQNQTFTATATDQFGNTMNPEPTFNWSVTGGGSITSAGVFTSGTVGGGPYTVSASASGVSGTAAITVVRTPPTIAIISPAANFVSLPNIANSLVLSASASDPLVTPSVTWSQASGPTGGTATFANASAANTSVSFSGTGAYVLNATASDGLLTTSQSLTVDAGIPVASTGSSSIIQLSFYGGNDGAASTGTIGGTYWTSLCSSNNSNTIITSSTATALLNLKDYTNASTNIQFTWLNSFAFSSSGRGDNGTTTSGTTADNTCTYNSSGVTYLNGSRFFPWGVMENFNAVHDSTDGYAAFKLSSTTALAYTFWIASSYNNGAPAANAGWYPLFNIGGTYSMSSAAFTGGTTIKLNATYPQGTSTNTGQDQGELRFQVGELSTPGGFISTFNGTTGKYEITFQIGSGYYSTSIGAVLNGLIIEADPIVVTGTAPQVYPGAAPAAIAGTPATLSGSASGTLATTWSLAGATGTGTVLFANAASPATTVTISSTGSYILSLTGSAATATVFQNLGLTATTPATPPTITSINTQTIAANTNTSALSFIVSDAQISAASLILTGSSSNTTLLPNSGIVFGGNAGNRTVTLTPAANQSGTATVTISVYDGTFTTTTSFTLTVTQTFASWAAAASGLGQLTGPMDDPSHQGIPNLLSYAFGLNPMAQNRAAMPSVSQQGGYLTITYRQSKSAPDLTFTVEATSNISSGSWSSSGITETSRQDMGSYWLVTDSDSVPMTSGTAPSRFLHLKVTMP